MRLRLDQNLSPRLSELLRDLGDTVVHVRQLGLERADDATVRAHAGEHDFAVVTKDGNFNNLAFLFGAPRNDSGLHGRLEVSGGPPW